MSDVFTIGHSTRSWESFLEVLQAHDIKVLADVRAHPGSRRYPQFNEEALEKGLVAAGIRYQALRELGGRRRPRPDSRNWAWRNESFRGYADYMESDEFDAAVRGLEDLARGERTAIMCSEAVWWRCHRSLVADALTARGWNVQHLMTEKKMEPHRLSAPARIVGDRVTYQASDEPSASRLLTE